MMMELSSRCVFFFKKKTAYEILRDWSSDVCSSDLPAPPNGCAGAGVLGGFFCDFLQQHLTGTLGLTQEQLENGGGSGEGAVGERCRYPVGAYCLKKKQLYSPTRTHTLQYVSTRRVT